MAQKQTSDSPGLKWRNRKNGLIPYWVAPPQAIKAGFKIKCWNLSHCPPEEIPARCQRMQAEALAFTNKYRNPYDGTIESLMTLYETHAESPFKRLKHTSLRTYAFYSARIAKNYGARRIANLTGLDVMRWHATWREAADGGKPHIGAASMALSVLKAALSFGQLCGLKDCAALRVMLSNLRLPAPKPRNEAPDVADVRAAMDAAAAIGCQSAAFAYALQFETAARQFDIIGQWVSIDDPRPSALHAFSRNKRPMKWLGPTWANIDANMVLAFTPSKTECTTGRRVTIDLKVCQLVMSQIASIPLEARSGPLVIDNRTGAPFGPRAFDKLWVRVRAKARLRPTLWNRDLRAGALTEGSMAGASSDDRAKLAAHSKQISQRVYDRDVLVSSRRVSELRAKFRADKG